MSLDDERKVVLEEDVTQQIYINQRMIMAIENSLGIDHPEVKALQERENAMLKVLEIDPGELRKNLGPRKPPVKTTPLYRDTIIGRDTVRLKI